ncbi:MAG: EAL domain-containing protein [Pseudomonadota bacterium]
MKEEILEGIRKDEFTFFYQPVVSLVTGNVVGAEVLIRWLKPDGTVLLPELFIPEAEKSELICTITRHMFPKLVQELIVLLDIDERLMVSFNASAKDFQDDFFTRMVLEQHAQAKLPERSLQVELTETVTLESGGSIHSNLMPLHEYGIPLAMDDFGIGYSSLDVLSKWPFTTIKLDKGIISRMLDSGKNSTIVESAVRMAHELNINVVAEGVESNDQYKHLLESGCTKVQGFWISKPMPLEGFISFVKQDMRWSGLPIGLIHMAIIDHVQWRKNLVSELTRLAMLPVDAHHRRCSNLPPLEVHECKLGRWYYGAGQVFRNHPSFCALDEPHRAFHEVGKKMSARVNGGAMLDELTPLLRELSDRSMQVMNCLQTLENEGLVDMHLAHAEWNKHDLHPSGYH